jgi:glycosyltransferase involved in cell wall biosynthesis
MDKETVYQNYISCDAVIFPSKLETWGLPITEAKIFKKPLILVNMPYAHETVGDYENVNFFNPNDHHALANLMLDILLKKWKVNPHTYSTNSDLVNSGWESLWCTLTVNL